MTTNPPPKVKGLFLLGNILDFLKDPFAYVDMVAAHGDVVKVNLAGNVIYYVFHPDDVAHILLKNAANYGKGTLMKRAKLVFGEGLILSEGEQWKSQRKRMAHSFGHRFVSTLADPIAELAASRLNDLEGINNIDETFLELTLELVMALLFGSSVGEDLDALSESFETISVHFSKILYQVPVPLWVPIPRNVRYNKAMTTMNTVVQRIMDDRRKGREPARPDILSKLLEESDSVPALNEALIRDELRTLMLAGHETTSLALTFSVWFLSGHPEFQAELAHTIQSVVGDGPVKGAHYSELALVSATVKEAIRLLPPVPIFGREANAADTLSGYDIPAGATLILCPLRTQKDPRWFEDPDTFNPKRWTPELKARLPRFAHYPFGGGARICIGMHLAMMEATLVLAEFIRRYRVVRTEESKLELLPSITLGIKSPLKLRLASR